MDFEASAGSSVPQQHDASAATIPMDTLTDRHGGARERYYAAIELDEDYVEARANLGCVLAEEGQIPLAEAAFRGALECHADFADAHYHLARLLDNTGQPADAAGPWERCLG